MTGLGRRAFFRLWPMGLAAMLPTPETHPERLTVRVELDGKALAERIRTHLLTQGLGGEGAVCQQDDHRS